MSQVYKTKTISSHSEEDGESDGYEKVYYSSSIGNDDDVNSGSESFLKIPEENNSDSDSTDTINSSNRGNDRSEKKGNKLNDMDGLARSMENVKINDNAEGDGEYTLEHIVQLLSKKIQNSGPGNVVALLTEDSKKGNVNNKKKRQRNRPRQRNHNDGVLTEDGIEDDELSPVQKDIVRNLQTTIFSNQEQINSHPKGFGKKFLLVSIACAFGGRVGLKIYDKKFPRLKLIEFQHKIENCQNPQNDLNVERLCFLGHVILYQWATNPEIKTALRERFGNLENFIGPMNNVKWEIGGKHLWHKDFKARKWSLKGTIILKLRKLFPDDEDVMKEILKNLGIGVQQHEEPTKEFLF